MRMSDEAKPSEGKGAKYELSVSVIPVDESKEKEKTLALSNALAGLVDSKKDKQISGDGEGVEKKEVEEKMSVKT